MTLGLDMTPRPTPAPNAAASTTTASFAATSVSSLSSNVAVLGPAPGSTESINIFEGVTPVTSVALEGAALLQIIKHCHDNLPGGVAGSLLGMDNEHVLEVTNSFPSPLSSERKKGADEYQLDMMKSLREVGMDNNKVGWYQSVAMGTFCTASFIEHQYQYQKSLGPNAICLIYDSAETCKGSLSLRAIRLAKAFMDTYKE
ncbi:unnamed protein product [Peronospora destructor]|uniref:MPN domain-containing protein n=1 Tax=Peronospora destructor TaxID=86335 RepID=A0AAV0UEZ3_9STRA|nr:unnamed protein product [Peronospora destructor]